ncbi:uncharacterized protein LOC143148234 isoform X1 [Ptiloglossa arizonensis]|uniref:uncharacterized protein LOC143148234 isoform X1 n=1 Tax=Ptiloglossa arizonensis TaxID=3350558 RepID=UPI003F9FFE01
MRERLSPWFGMRPLPLTGSPARFEDSCGDTSASASAPSLHSVPPQRRYTGKSCFSLANKGLVFMFLVSLSIAQVGLAWPEFVANVKHTGEFPFRIRNDDEKRVFDIVFSKNSFAVRSPRVRKVRLSRVRETKKHKRDSVIKHSQRDSTRKIIRA